MTPSETADRICGSVADLVTLADRATTYSASGYTPYGYVAGGRALSVAADLLTTANAVLGHGDAA